MIAVIDYEMGNLRSVGNALSRLGAQWCLTASPSEIRAASHVLLPGVGNDAEAMGRLRERGLVEVIRGLRRPVLGICVGMQVMCSHSEEGDVDCMDIFDTRVRRFPAEDGLKVPHMGWNTISNIEGKMLRDVGRHPYVYYVHSYYAELCQDTVATTRYGSTIFSAALRYENFYGTQFHPEKSGSAGEKILANFLRL